MGNAVSPGLERARKTTLFVFGVWFGVGLVVVGLDLRTPFGPWADLAFIAFASIVLFLYSLSFVRWRPLLILFAIYAVVSGGVEAYGAATGVLFGSYQYSGRFGPLVFGLLPVTIPLAWWVVVWPLHCLVQQVFGEKRGVILVPFITALLAVWADLVIEPAATLVRGYWTWEADGFYYGVPWSNFLGWFGTALVLSGISRFFPVDAVASRSVSIVLAAVLSATIFTFLLLSLVYGKWLAVGVAIGFFCALFLLLRRAAARSS